MYDQVQSLRVDDTPAKAAGHAEPLPPGRDVSGVGEGPGYWNVTTAEYNADMSRDRHTSLELFAQSDLAYHAYYVERSRPLPEPTPAMVFGSALHAWVLESHQAWLAQYVILPEDIDRRTKAGKERYEIWSHDAQGRTPISREELCQITEMTEAIRSNPQAAAILYGPDLYDQDGLREKAIRWDDRETGLPLKVRFDRLLPAKRLAGDIKTVADPSPEGFSRAMANFGWHRQAALYVQGAWQALQLEIDFVFVAVGKTWPHETVCYYLDEAALATGMSQVQRHIRELADRKASGDWTGRTQRRLVQVGLPRWAQEVVQ